MSSLTPDVNELATELLSPPYLISPHVTTDPSFFNAAKALPLETISITPVVSFEETSVANLQESPQELSITVESPPVYIDPQVITCPSVVKAPQ